MNDFRSISFSPQYASYLDSVNNIVKANAKTFEATLYDAINSEILSVNGKKTKFKKLLFKRPVVMIDCWASWCAPCIYQMSFMPEIEKEYRNKVDFIYLSFDKNISNWTNKSETLNLNYSDNYLLPKNFKSDFANYFDITSIPRYILFDKHGKVITDHAPRPSGKANLKKILDNAINGR